MKLRANSKCSITDLHAKLKYSTLFKRLEEKTGKKFKVECDNIFEYDKEKEGWVLYTKAALNEIVTKQCFLFKVWLGV